MMSQQVEFLGKKLSLRTQCFINNEFVDSVSGKKFDNPSPINDEVICRVSEGDSADVDKAVKAARAALDGPWGSMTGPDRVRIINRFADLIEQHSEQLTTIEVCDNGKPYSEAKVDVMLSFKCLCYYAGYADKIHGKTIPVEGDWFCYTRREPMGVVGQIIPWNFPLLMAAWKLGPALCTGNTIVLKPAEQTPLSALYIGDLAIAAGLPAGVLNIIPGFGPTAGAAIARHMDVDKVAFTGSVEVGRLIQRMACESNLKSCTLELGGKSPNIILNDADLEQAVTFAQAGIFFNQGEVCTAGSRLYVQEDVYERVVGKLVEEARKIRCGDPFDPATQMGAQVSREQYQRILGYIEVGKKEGATLLCGGAPIGAPAGCYIQPTIFGDVCENHRIFQEEIFGPVLSVIKFKSVDDAILSANRSTYGLGAAVFTRDIGKAFTVANRIRAGTVWVNGYHCYDAAAPFGGMKESGVGREKGKEALEAYTETKTIFIKQD